jgi:aldose 1-epimerase
MQLHCDKYTKLNQELITEQIEEVNEVMDFRRLHKIGDYINDESLQNHTAKGYDHCWLKTEPEKAEIAVMQDDLSGRRLKVSSSYPAVVCYAGCYPKSFLFNENKKRIEQYHSICLECQFVPNGINMNDVDKAILKKGEEYNHFIKYSFDLVEE